MAHYAVRQDVANATKEDLQAWLGEADAEQCRALAGYWTPDEGRLLSVFVSAGAEQPRTFGPEQQVLSVLPITAEEYGPPIATQAADGNEELQLVLVRRQLDPLTQTEFRAIALQAIMCAYEYTDMRWLRSYWATETNQLFCLFETRTHDLVREHAERSRIPCDEIHDAIEVSVGPVGAVRHPAV